MTYTNVLADGEGQSPELKGAPHGIVYRIAGLHRGMASGRGAVLFAIRMDDGSLACAEVSMNHFFIAAAMFEAEYTPFERGRE